MKYIFFYDETEHSRKINYETVTANNYYDNFITGIVGWKAEDDECISDRYLAFESKYDYRKKDGELKSQTMKVKDFRLGFASLNNHTIELYEDLVSLFDEKIIIYFSVFSKIEYVISQLFVNYHNSMFVDVDYMKCWYKDCCVSEHTDSLRCGKPEIDDGSEKMRMLIKSEEVQRVIGEGII